MGCTQSAPDKGAEGGITNSSQDQIDGQEAAQAAAMVLGSADMSSQVELKFGCRHLPKMDTLSKSDPVVILYQSKPGKTRDWHEVGRTEVIQNTHDPDFTTSVVMRYTFEAMQPLKVVVYDVDTPAVQRSSDLDLSRQEYIGETTFFLSSVMTAPSQRLERQLSRSSDHPRLTLSQACCVVVTAEEMSQAQATVHLAFSAKNLDNVERFSKSDPFLRVLRLREGGDWLPVLKTEVKDNNLDPVWQPIEVDIRQLCNADGARPLRIEVLDYENNGSHRLLGECQTSLDQLLTIAASPSPMVDLVNPKKSGRKGYQNSGVLVVRSATVKPRPSFLQYITGGCQLNFAVAIDFTGSNGDPRMPSSLHFLSPAPTMYEEAIKAVGGVLEHYDTDKLFPVWGFGAALPPSFTVSHCFAVGGSPGQPEVEGVQGILRAYRDTLPTLKLSGPTLFSPVITAAANMARQAAAGPGLGYIILLIITDGCIMDMDQTKEAIVEASGLPLSLLIVGVGDADFDAMEVLDGDKEPVSYKGRVAQRDIVQFVPLKATLREKGGMQAIAQELLAEIPGQVVGYFHGLRGILPRGGGPPSAPPMGGWH